MSQIVKPVRWAPFCRGLVAPKWQSARHGLKHLYMPASWGHVDHVGSLDGTGYDGASLVTQYGEMWGTSTTGMFIPVFIGSGFSDTEKAFTMLVVARNDTVATAGNIMYHRTPRVTIGTPNSSTLLCNFGGTTISYTHGWSDGVLLRLAWLVKVGAANEQEIYENGVLKQSGSITDIFGTTPSSGCGLGCRYNVLTSENWPGGIGLVAFYDRRWSVAEVMRWTNDPFGPFRMDCRVLVAVPSGAQQVNLTAASATWTAASVAVGLGAISVNLSAASATWAAPSVGVSLGLQVDLSAASATWAAAAVGVQLGAVSVNLSSAPATWAAGSVSVGLGGISVAVSSASATWTAPAVGVQFGGISVSLTSASATWTAVAVTPDTGIQVSLNAASATWTAAAVGIQLGGVSVSLTAASATWSATALASVLTVPAVVVLTNFAIAVAELSNVTVAIGTLANVDVAIPELASVTLEEW